MESVAMQGRLKWLGLTVIGLLAVGVATCSNAYSEFFLKRPDLVAVGAVAAFLAYLPSLWVIRRLDQRPFAWTVYGFAILFVIATSPVVSHVTWLLMQQDIIYWKIVGIVEETAKLFPVLLLALLVPHAIRSRRDGVIIGALAGLGFATIEYAVAFALDNFPERGWSDLATSLPARWALGTQAHIIWGATTGGMIGYLREVQPSAKRVAVALGAIVVVILTHSAQDFMGKLIAPLSIAALGQLLLSAGITEETLGENALIVPTMLVFGTVINTLLINLFVLPILWWLLRSGPGKNAASSLDNDRNVKTC